MPVVFHSFSLVNAGKLDLFRAFLLLKSFFISNSWYLNIFIYICTQQNEIDMKNLNNKIMEMGLTERQIKLIAFEADGVDAFAPNMMNEFSNRVFKLILSAKGQPSYVVRRCVHLATR